MKKFLLVVITLISVWKVGAQTAKIEWAKCYGGSSIDDEIKVIPTFDGGYIMGGRTRSTNWDIDSIYSPYDFYVIKMSKQGNVEWKKNYGGTGMDWFFDIIQSRDSNYLLVGNTQSFDKDLSNATSYGSWVLKISKTGSIIWSKTFGGDNLRSIEQTKDGGYVLGSNYYTSARSFDAWIFKIDSLGSLQWQKKYGGTKEDDIEVVHQTTDGGFIVGASTASIDGDLASLPTKGSFDYWIFKTDSIGNIQWQKRFGGSDLEFTKDLIITKDSSYLFIGASASIDGDFVGNHGQNDISVIKVSKSGNLIWKKILGGSKSDYGYALCETKDGNYLVGGSSQSIDGDRSTALGGGRDIWLLSLYATNGSIKWEKVIGGAGEEEIRNIKPTKDNGYIIGSRLAYGNNDYVFNYHFDSSSTSNQWDDWAIYKLKPFNPTLQGYIFTDHNSNSIKDTLEPYKANIKVQLSNGNYTFTDKNGFYQIQADSIGAYTLTVTAPTGYNALPQTINYNFTSWDTVINKNIALQPITSFDSVSIICTPIVSNAIQGNPLPYWITYENCGTKVLSPLVNLDNDKQWLLYDSCTDAGAVNTATGLLTGTVNMQPSVRKDVIGYFTLKPTTNIGDTLVTKFGASTATVGIADSFYMIIEGASAGVANAQRAIQKLTVAQVAAGKEINYTIYFKNDGNDTVYNVIITDTLSSYLQANTVKMIANSHNCKTTVKGNVVTFELLNIKLPKAATNNLKSMGFVSFSIKPKTNLAIGTVITNKANTYYNYRLPQATTATTVVVGALPLTMSSYQVVMSNERQVLNKWTTVNEINVAHFNVQRSTNGIDFINIGKVKANNKSSNEYSFVDELKTKDQYPKTLYYRIESVDNDGKKQYSTTKQITIKSQIANSIAIYPNPTNGVVNIEATTAKQIAIIDAMGKTVKQYNNIIKHQTIDTKQFTKGIYMVQITMQDGTIKNEKLVVE